MDRGSTDPLRVGSGILNAPCDQRPSQSDETIMGTHTYTENNQQYPINHINEFKTLSRAQECWYSSMHINTFIKQRTNKKKWFPIKCVGIGVLALLLPKLLFLCWFDTLSRKPRKTNIFARVPNTKIDRHVQIDVPETHSLFANH